MLNCLLRKKLLSYATREEAKKIKEQVGDTLLGVVDNVVSVGTRCEKIGDMDIYCVKIGLESDNDINSIPNIISILKKENIISYSFDEIKSSDIEYLPTFMKIGKITACQVLQQ
jgi:hypothetical protein